MLDQSAAARRALHRVQPARVIRVDGLALLLFVASLVAGVALRFWLVS